MARTGLTDMRSLADPMLNYNYDLIIPNVPGGGSGRELKLRCMDVVLPGMYTEDVEINYHGVRLPYAGAQMWPNKMSITFHETRDVLTRKIIKSWIERENYTRQNTGNYKATYATNAQLLIYDQRPTVSDTVNIYSLFPTNLEDIPLGGAGSSAVAVRVDFAYDYTEDV